MAGGRQVSSKAEKSAFGSFGVGRTVKLGAVLRDELQNHGHVSPTARLSAITH
jgi:hypothetical protein